MAGKGEEKAYTWEEVAAHNCAETGYVFLRVYHQFLCVL